MNIDNYEREMFLPGSHEFFILPSGSVLIRNIDKKGNLVKYRSLKKFKEKSVPMWVECQLHLFRDNTNLNFFLPTQENLPVLVVQLMPWILLLLVLVLDLLLDS